jgi:ABC-type polysaccharide/polyol phosphate transport system ATPase subunit
VNPAISVEGLGKRYVITHRTTQRYRTLRDDIAEKIGSALRRSGNSLATTSAVKEDFWAVRDVSFQVKEGDRVGIIGRNGAGKSTLLKMLSRITEPTQGRIALQGRVASLMEVGTGFHPELSGRENIFLNGSILGMRRQEIQAKFDEIVAFSGVEKFLDTPVKRYSSGMYVRLAFAVAAHLDSEILVVDEVLAVGDAEFQAKCLSRMEAIGASGRTVLFVSHNLSAVQRLCNSGVFMNGGRLVTQGPISNVLEAYQDAISGTSADSAGVEVNPGQAKFTAWELKSAATGLSHTCRSRDVCRFVFSLVSRRAIQDTYFGLALWDSEGRLIVAGSSLDNGGRANDLLEGEHEVVFEVRLPIKAGAYQLDISLNGVGEGQIDRWHAEPKLIVLPSGDSSLPERWHGVLNEMVRFNGPGI